MFILMYFMSKEIVSIDQITVNCNSKKVNKQKLIRAVFVISSNLQLQLP